MDEFSIRTLQMDSESHFLTYVHLLLKENKSVKIRLTNEKNCSIINL